MVNYFSFLIGNGHSFFVKNTVEASNNFEYTSRHLIMLLYSKGSYNNCWNHRVYSRHD